MFNLFQIFWAAKCCICIRLSTGSDDKIVKCCFGLQVRVPLYHASPNVSRPVTQLTEDEQVKIAKRIGLIQHLPSGVYDGTKKVKE